MSISFRVLKIPNSIPILNIIPVADTRPNKQKPIFNIT